MKSRLLKSIYASVYGSFRNPLNKTFILNGHELGNHTKDPVFKFRSLLKGISKKYDLISFDKAVLQLKNNIPLTKPQLAFSFDDGFKDCLIIAKILEEFDITAGFFISPEYIDGLRLRKNRIGSLYLMNKKFLNLKDLEMLVKNGHTIGAHTYNHTHFDSITTKEDFNHQIICEKKIIEQRLAISCKNFAFPYGRLSNYENFYLNEIKTIYLNLFLSDNSSTETINNGLINRRHFECYWNHNEVNYFLSKFK